LISKKQHRSPPSPVNPFGLGVKAEPRIACHISISDFRTEAIRH
jgi:hypothetical protein